MVNRPYVCASSTSAESPALNAFVIPWMSHRGRCKCLAVVRGVALELSTGDGARPLTIVTALVIHRCGSVALCRASGLAG